MGVWGIEMERAEVFNFGLYNWFLEYVNVKWDGALCLRRFRPEWW